MKHELKCWPTYFVAVQDGTKPFEVRRDDRPYSVGDTLTLKEWYPSSGTYSGRECSRTISYVLRNASHFGVSEGFVVLGLAHAEG